MKSILALAAVAASLSLVACGGDAADTNATDTTAVIDSTMNATPEQPSTPAAVIDSATAVIDSATSVIDSASATIDSAK
ncbi:MAG TPA: hypothetical protein VNA88_13065 [Candidatus Kapabacteria bacterium]|jgi:hypothetical protein|nr:hypothetical protein [Candidatus Kapabacteria bacterium]